MKMLKKHTHKPSSIISAPTPPPATPSVTTPALLNGPATFTDSLPLPSLIVFDLDYTLWPFWVDTHVSPPLKSKDNHTKMLDRHGESFTFYPGVPGVLHAAHDRGIALGLASRTQVPELAREMLRGLVVTVPGSLHEDEGVVAEPYKTGGGGGRGGKEKPTTMKRAVEYFQYVQIFPGSKTGHFAKIQEATRKAGREVPYRDMLFFDDEGRNRNVETELGVTFCLVRDGVTKEEVDRGVWAWRKRRGLDHGKGSSDDYESD